MTAQHHLRSLALVCGLSLAAGSFPSYGTDDADIPSDDSVAITAQRTGDVELTCFELAGKPDILSIGDSLPAEQEQVRRRHHGQEQTIHQPDPAGSVRAGLWRPIELTMETYLVGGAVRDRLLGRPVEERDYVVVGATPEQMRELGFRQVGSEFPVFLHPETHEEYALARTERKTAPGYRGFRVHADPAVTLEEDLRRRDLTINALAEDSSGNLIDPYGGLQDLERRLLRHVSDAFCEDPVRILRVARFAARYADLGFQVAPETNALMRRMVEQGEVDALVPERVWKELERALGETTPTRFFTTLEACGALQRLFPELARLRGVAQPADWHPEIDTWRHTLMVLERAAQLSLATEVRFAALTHDLGKGTTPREILPSHHGHGKRGADLVEALCTRLKAPRRFRDLAQLTARYHCLVHKLDQLRPASILDLLLGLDALRRPERLDPFLLACQADYQGREGFAARPFPQADRLRSILLAVRATDLRPATAKRDNPEGIRQRVRQLQVQAVRRALGEASVDAPEEP